MKRGTTLSIVVGAVIAGAFLVGAGCGGPYKGKAERPPKVKKTKEPEDVVVPVAAQEIKWIDDCAAKFVDDPSKAKNSAAKADPLVSQGDAAVAQARSTDDEGNKGGFYLAAVDSYRKALLEDNYNAQATYNLAVVYARLWRKGCALKMIQRLASLTTNPRFVRGGSVTINGLLDSVETESAFKAFKKDAMQAAGR